MKNLLVLLVFILIFSFGCNDSKEKSETKSGSAEPTSSSIVPINPSKETEEEKHFYMLTKSLQENFEAGNIAKVQSSIKELESLLPKFENNWNYGNAIHKMNLIEGRISLKEGKIEEAKKYLIAAGKTKGSPQLNSFGPNITLAKELLEKGETEVVIQYLDLCNNFWTSEFSNVDEWKKIIQKGEIPQFGAHLKY